MTDFSIEDSIITVIVGIDGSVPPFRIRLDMESIIETEVNEQVGFEQTRDTVNLTTVEHPSQEQMEVLGPATLHIHKFDVNLGDKAVDMGVVNATHNTVVEKLSELGFTISGTATVWNNKFNASGDGEYP